MESEQPQKCEWLDKVDGAFEMMLASIRAAKKSIRLEVYIYRGNGIGERFREALIQACLRGLQVHVMTDALGSVSLTDAFWDPFIKAGGKFRWFNPLKLKRLGFRDHRKILVCDEEVAYIGGFNIAPEYQGDGVTSGWHDVGARLPESFARELASSFDAMFALADFKHRRFTRLRRSQIKKATEVPEGRLLVNGPGRGPNFIQSALLADLKTARKIHLISAYFLPPRQFRRSLVLAARAGGDVRLILPGKSDVLVSQLAARHLYHTLFRAGIRIYEYQPQILHSKLFLIEQALYVGSANLDKRSLYTNYELLVRLEEPRLLECGRAFFEKTLLHCKEVDPAAWGHSRSLWAKLKEQWSYLILSKLDPYVTQLQLRLWEATGQPPARSSLRRKETAPQSS